MTIDEVKVGDKLVCDGGFTCVKGGFTCVKEGAVVVIQEDKNGLYFECEEGRHYLDGQVGSAASGYTDRELIGLSPAS